MPTVGVRLPRLGASAFQATGTARESPGVFSGFIQALSLSFSFDKGLLREDAKGIPTLRVGYPNVIIPLLE